MSHQTNYNRS